MQFVRPSRRKTRLGTRAELIPKAKALGIKVSNDDPRRWLVRKLWAVHALPGSVDIDRAARAARLAKLKEKWKAEDAAKAS